MGRASKLFLSSRKSSIASQGSASSSREYQSQLSKPERILGATGLQDAARHQLPRRPSYVSLIPSVSDVNEDVDGDDFSQPGQIELEPLPLRLANLQQSGVRDRSSRCISSSDTYTRSFLGEQSRRIKGSWSSTTLKTHYEQRRAQNGRHSSSPFSPHPDPRQDTPRVCEAEHSRRPSTATNAMSRYDRNSSIDGTTALPDITRLHPTAAFTQHHQSASREVPHCISDGNVGTSRFPGVAPTSRPNTSAGSLKKKTGHTGKGLRSHLSVEAFPTSVKFFTRKQHPSQSIEVQPARQVPRRKAQQKNWWDRYPVNEEGSDAESEHDPDLVTPTEPLFPPVSNRAQNSGRTSYKVHEEERSQGGRPLRKLSSPHEIVSARSSATLRNLAPLPNRGSRPISRMSTRDLHETSVLSVSSSSESESELEDGDDLAMQNIRDSIAVSEIDVHHVGQAQALPLKTMRRIPERTSSDRRPSLASISSIPTTADSSSIISASQGPAYLSVPNRTSRTRKSGHTCQPSSIPEDSDASSHAHTPTSPSTSMQDFSVPAADNRRLMAVTEEEEALLEMMRRKRADKAAQRDSGLASIKSAKTAASTRPFSGLSGSSSILDSFPISRSQRSSLLASRSATHPHKHEGVGSSRDHERDRKRQSVATNTTDNSNYSIDSRIESPTRMKYAFTPHLSLASVDVSLNTLHRPEQDDTSLPSTQLPEAPSSPCPRSATRGSVRPESIGNRDSSAAYAYGDQRMPNKAFPPRESGEKSRRKTTSNTTPQASPRTENFEQSLPSASIMIQGTSSGDEDTSPALSAQGSSSSESSKRASIISKSTSDCGSACGHAACSTNRRSSGPGVNIGSRCSVSEDVLAAWGSLGGWREVPGVTA